jgi:large subunit ribosomal protein L2
MIKDLPEGTLIYNIESKPGDGGKFCRASGAAAKIMSKTDNEVTIIFPSKKKKTLVGSCRATIGVVAGGGRTEKPLVKAGTAHHKYKAKNKLYPIVSGGAMNAVDHPFGNKRSSRKSKAKPVPKNAPPGRKVGMIRPSRSGRKKK